MKSMNSSSRKNNWARWEESSKRSEAAATNTDIADECLFVCTRQEFISCYVCRRSAILYSLVILSLSCLTSVKTGLKVRVNLGEVRISRERSIDANLAAGYKHYRHGGLTVYSIISPAGGISRTNI